MIDPFLTALDFEILSEHLVLPKRRVLHDVVVPKAMLPGTRIFLPQKPRQHGLGLNLLTLHLYA